MIINKKLHNMIVNNQSLRGLVNHCMIKNKHKTKETIAKISHQCRDKDNLLVGRGVLNMFIRSMPDETASYIRKKKAERFIMNNEK